MFKFKNSAIFSFFAINIQRLQYDSFNIIFLKPLNVCYKMVFI